MTSASRTTERRICLRLPPIIRTSANSRARWATVIDIVLKMMNAPTNSATSPNADQDVADDVEELLERRRCRSGPGSAPTRPGPSAGRTGATGFCSCAGDGARLRVDQDRVDLALLLEQPLRGGQREHRDRGVADRLDVAEAQRCRRSGTARPVRGRSRRSCRRCRSRAPSAAPASIAISSSAAGNAPASKLNGLSAAAAGSRAVEPDREGGRALGLAEDLPVATDQARLVAQLARRDVDLGDRGDAADDRVVDAAWSR